MLKRSLDSEDEILDTPFIRRYRDQVVQARIETYQQTILEAVSQRLDPRISVYQRLEQELAEIKDLERLQQLFTFALQVQNLESFMAVLTE